MMKSKADSPLSPTIPPAKQQLKLSPNHSSASNSSTTANRGGGKSFSYQASLESSPFSDSQNQRMANERRQEL